MQRQKGKPVPTQMVECKCEICGSIFNRMYRNAIIDTICIKCKKSKRAIDYNKAQKGKTFEERYGKEKAEEIKILHDSGEIKFTDRYEQKYQECVSKE